MMSTVVQPELERPPRDVPELRALIVSRRLQFSPQLQRIVEMGLARPEVIAFGTAASIAVECHVAITTVQRLPKFLGMRSVKDVKRLFQGHLAALRNGGSEVILSFASTANDANGAI